MDSRLGYKSQQRQSVANRRSRREKLHFVPHKSSTHKKRFLRCSRKKSCPPSSKRQPPQESGCRGNTRVWRPPSKQPAIPSGQPPKPVWCLTLLASSIFDYRTVNE